MTEQEVADLLCVSERKVRDMRTAYLEEGRHFGIKNGRLGYTADGVAMLAASLGVDVTELGLTAQDAPAAVEGVQEQGPVASEPATGQADGLNGEKTAQPPMVRVKISRCLPNRRQYVGRVVGECRVVRVKTRRNMGFTVNRVLWVIDHGDWCEFDRRAARMRVVDE